MKKYLMSTFIILFILVGCSKEEPVVEEVIEEVVDVEPTPVAYSEPIYLVTTADSGITTVADLTDKLIVRQVAFDSESSDYVVDQLLTLGLTDDNFVGSTYYQEIPNFINDKKADAWIIGKDYHELNSDFRPDYDKNSYVIIEEYQIPYYEEQAIESSILDHVLNTEPFTVMLTGIDERVAPNETARNDVNILLTVDPVNKHYTTVGFPRDSYVYDTCRGVKDKLTHIGFYGGPDCVKNSIGAELDVEVDYFVQVSFSSFIDLINDLGGITIDIPLDMTMDQNSYRDVSQPIKLQTGEHKIWGEEALALARNRKYSGIYGGDWGRIRNQQLILNGMIERVAKNPFIVMWSGLDWLHSELAYHNFKSETDDIAALIYLAEAFTNDYTVDNYFVETYHSSDANGLYIGAMYNDSLEIASLKVKHTLGEEIDSSNKHYVEVMKGYITGGSGNQSTKYIGTEYDLKQ